MGMDILHLSDTLPFLTGWVVARLHGAMDANAEVFVVQCQLWRVQALVLIQHSLIAGGLERCK